MGDVRAAHIYTFLMNTVTVFMQFWSKRLSRLESVRNQLNSVVVLNILHNLEQAHSTYAQAFLHVHRYGQVYGTIMNYNVHTSIHFKK